MPVVKPSNRSTHRRRAALLAATIAAAASAEPADASTWANPAGGSWETASNWTGGLPGTGEADLGLGVPGGYTVSLSAFEAPDTFNVAAGSVTLVGTGTGFGTTGGVSAGVNAAPPPIPNGLKDEGLVEVGTAAGQTASLTVGPTASVYSTYSLSIGANGGTGNVVIQGSGSVSSGIFNQQGDPIVPFAIIGNGHGSVGTLSVAGGGLFSASSLSVGQLGGTGTASLGRSTLSIQDAGDFLVGFEGVGLVTVGSVSTTDRSQVEIGADGQGTVTLTSGGSFNGTVFVGVDGTGSVGTLNAANATVSVSDLELGFNNGTGVLNVAGPNASLSFAHFRIGGSAQTCATFAGGATLNSPSSSLSVLAGSLVLFGSGTTGHLASLTIGGTQYGYGVEPVLVSVTGGATVTLASGLFSYPDGTLQLASGGTLKTSSANFTSGTVDLSLSADNLTAAPLTVTGAATLGGSLSVTLDPGFYPYAGQTFDLFAFEGGETGTFSAASLASPGAGLSWDTSKLYTAGTITAVPEPAAVGLLGLAATPLLARRRRRT